jgi:hypothetical protein
MKINPLDAHDRLLDFKKQADYISQGCRDCIKNRPKAFENYPFYIFAHARTADDGVSKRLIWIPRINKPRVETNSILIMSFPPSDMIKIIWKLPAPELWQQYEKGKMIEDKDVIESIHLFKTNRKKLQQKEPEEVSEEKIRYIMNQVRLEKIERDRIKLNSLEVSLT